MVYVVDGYTFNGYQIVLTLASFNVDAAPVLSVGLYAGQHLGVSDRIGIAQNLRKVTQLFQAPDCKTSVSGLDGGPVAVTLNVYAVQGNIKYTLILLSVNRE